MSKINSVKPYLAIGYNVCVMQRKRSSTQISHVSPRSPMQGTVPNQVFQAQNTFLRTIICVSIEEFFEKKTSLFNLDGTLRRNKSD